LAVIVGFGMIASLVTGGWDRDWRGGPGNDREREQQGRPGGLLFVVGGVVVVGAGATALAYRRISRPVGDLLGAAGQVAEGDYEVRLHPEGPRELRLLTNTFNDMAARLAATDEQRRRFLADVTHELRTPLAVLQSGVEAQLDGVHARDDAHLTSLLEEIQRLGRLIEDLHTLAMAEAGSIVLHRERVAPTVLVEETILAHTALAGRQGIELRSEPAAGLSDLEVDPGRIRQVLDNLMSNAVRHTPAGGEVRLRAELDRDKVRFTVTDSGAGFQEDLDQVFERFTRAADSRGSGLGLSIARDLVQAHGGSIEARNEPDGGGASVTFEI
jgi:signal transduction histidine kinase